MLIYGNIRQYGNLLHPCPTLFGNLVFLLPVFLWLDQVTMFMLTILSNSKFGRVPRGNNMFGEMVFDSCFQTLASKPRKTHQLIGVSLNPLWMAGTPTSSQEGNRWRGLARRRRSKCRITQLGICPDLGQLLLSLLKRAQH